MVKIDTINFGVLMSRITALTGSSEFYHGTVMDIYDLVKQCVVEENVPAPLCNPTVGGINDLMSAIHGRRKIDAIKAYRSLTGYGLKEAKDAVEACWLAEGPVNVSGSTDWPFKPSQSSQY